MRSGKGHEYTVDRAEAEASQWSLTFEVRKSTWGAQFGDASDTASQWSLTFEVRKSARSLMGSSVMRSQWSLTFEVRKRSCDCGRVDGTAVRRNGA